jgi:hypothetical protein
MKVEHVIVIYSKQIHLTFFLNSGYQTPVPRDYDDLPQLKGRATVEMVLKKADGEKFNIEGQLFNEAKMKMIIDGYAAPVTGGNFIDLVQKGTFWFAASLSFLAMFSLLNH